MKLPWVSRKKYEALQKRHNIMQDAVRKFGNEILRLQSELAKYKRPRDEKGRFVKR